MTEVDHDECYWLGEGNRKAVSIGFVHVDTNVEKFVSWSVKIRAYVPVAEAISRAQKAFMTIELDHLKKFAYAAFMNVLAEIQRWISLKCRSTNCKLVRRTTATTQRKKSSLPSCARRSIRRLILNGQPWLERMYWLAAVSWNCMRLMMLFQGRICVWACEDCPFGPSLDRSTSL